MLFSSLVTGQIFLLSLIISSAFSLNDKVNQIVSNFHRVMAGIEPNVFPAINASLVTCLTKYQNESLKVKCHAGVKQENCEGPPDPRTAWLLRCISNIMISSRFTIPVYIVHGPDHTRYKRIKKELRDARMYHVHVHSNHMANSINTTHLKTFFHEIKKESAEQDIATCLKVYSYTQKSKVNAIRCFKNHLRHW